MIAAGVMADLGAKIARGLLVVAVGALAFGYTRYLSVKVEVAETNARVAQEGVAARDQTIAVLMALKGAQERLSNSLASERDGIRQQMSDREIMMRKLQDENADIRAWAATAVPGDVARLREHATLTGAAAYRQFLSQGATLQPARRSDPD